MTELLLAWSQGDQRALNRLMPMVLDELRRTARRFMRRERQDHSLQATALVNEACLRLMRLNRVQWQCRSHFFGLAAQLMRQVLVDHARARGYQKRGGAGRRRIPLDEVGGVAEKHVDLVALDDALAALSALDRRKGRVVELRFFGGLTVAETAEALQVSPETVMRDWKFSRVWLLERLGGRMS